MKYKRFDIIVLSLLFAYYLLLVYEFNFCTINFHFISTLVLFIPIVLILLIYVLAKKKKIKANIGLGFSISLIVSFLILNFFTLIFVFFKEGTSYEDNPYRYKHIYSIAGYKEYTYQFPNKIPEEIIQNNNVKFYYSPQFLQGGFNLELLMKMKNEEINEYIYKFQECANEVIEVDSENINSLYSKYGIYEPYDVFKDESWNDFINGGTIYLLDSKPYKFNDWNHGCVVYIAKNENLEKILIVTQIW